MFTISEIESLLSCISRQLPYPDDAVSELLFDSRKLLLPAKTLFFAICLRDNPMEYHIVGFGENPVQIRENKLLIPLHVLHHGF